MRQVLIALVPAAVDYVWFFGFGLIANLIIAAAAATGTEALMLRLRRQSTVATLNDYNVEHSQKQNPHFHLIVLESFESDVAVVIFYWVPER